MEKRLVKVAQELNVGISTIVEYLNSHGFSIENKPTSKLTEEMEGLLHQEYSKSIAIKEQADQLIIGVRPGARKEPEAKPETPPTPTATPPVFKKPDLFKKAPVFNKEEPAPPPPPPAPAPPAPPAPAETVEDTAEVVGKPKVELTVNGKIELDKKGMPVKPKEEKAEDAAPAAKEEDAPDTDEKTKPETIASEPAAPKPKTKKTGAKKAKAGKPDTAKPEAREEEKAPEKGKSKSAQPKEEAEETEETAVGDEVIRMQAPELRGLKILGKIDIKKKEGKGKKKKDDKDKGKSGERPKKGGAKSDERKDKPVASSSDAEEARKKRKRTRRKVSASPSTGTDTTARKGGRRRGDSTREVPTKERDEQIRKTMATISGSGKKKRQKLRREARERVRERQELRDMEGVSSKLQVTEFVTVQELANLMNISATQVITTCMSLGVIVSINQRLDAEIIELVASEFDHEIEFISIEEHTEVEEEIQDAPEDLKPRAPIVTVMGHVDHGKTSLLDYIREANVVGGEAGGITQHIGAYEVVVTERKITFLDTPGHEAFTAMRARGTKVTDIAIIVIAADDNIMPQTKEAISHAQAAGVPMVFAINKIDKDGAQPEKIKQELASMNILVEDWGGEHQSQDISAKTGAGIEKLLEKLLLVADMAELKANPGRPAIGTIIEATLDKGKGYVAKILVQTGTLRISDPVVAGEHSGKIKAMFNERGKRVKEAGPSTPVLILGLSGAPQAGERFKVMDNESEARQLAAKRGQINREQANRATKRISLDEIGRRLALGTFRELNLIVKGDVDGSVEALSDALIKLSLETVQVNVIHRAVGQIIESDVLLASASDAIIIGFQVRPSLGARKLAEREGVEIKLYSIIYEAIEEVKLAIEGLLEPTKEEKIICNIEVREVYKISKVGTVAGCVVLDGKVSRNTRIRIVRDGIVVYPTKEGASGELASLKRFKEDVKEVKTGLECGLTIKNYNDIKAGDIVEGFEIIEIKQKYG
jgi:translation initiation factor IF-2